MCCRTPSARNVAAFIAGDVGKAGSRYARGLGVMSIVRSPAHNVLGRTENGPTTDKSEPPLYLPTQTTLNLNRAKYLDIRCVSGRPPKPACATFSPGQLPACVRDESSTFPPISTAVMEQMAGLAAREGCCADFVAAKSISNNFDRGNPLVFLEFSPPPCPDGDLSLCLFLTCSNSILYLPPHHSSNHSC